MAPQEDIDSALKRLESENARLHAENARLRALVKSGEDDESAATHERHEQVHRQVVLSPPPASAPPAETAPTLVCDASPSAAKLALFRSLFFGRQDVHARRWESSRGTSGYSPACANEWRSGLCDKRRVKCGECANRALLALDDAALREHLSGRAVVGIYPLLADESCRLLVVDFDGAAWRSDARAFAEALDEAGLAAHIEISRSGEGAHVWLFFESSLEAARARRLGCGLLSQAARRRHQVGLRSYDRLFPNQDTLPKGGFGNLIALPLQRKQRGGGRTVFVDADFAPYDDQWRYLASIQRLSPEAVDGVLARLDARGGAVGVRAYVATAPGEEPPWELPPPPPRLRPEVVGCVPPRVAVVRANLAYIEKAGLPESLLDQLARLAAFENPEFHRAQAMRLPTYDKPRVIACAEEFDDYVGLPRGCLGEVVDVLEGYGSTVEVRDKRNAGRSIEVHFAGHLREDQQQAAATMLASDEGVLSAGTAFGKTVVAAHMIAERGVNTLVVVHRRQLMEQWRERLATFLDLPLKAIGLVGGGKRKPTGKIDVAVIQSLVRSGHVDDLVTDYGHVIVDECHHVSAVSFEAVLRHTRARYVVGLTSTPIRKDGHHPIITMQCGPVRFKTDLRQQAALRPFEHVVRPRITTFALSTEAAEVGIQEIYRALAADEGRNALLVDDIAAAVEEGRSPLVLTERTGHRDLLAERLSGRVSHVFALSSGMGVRRRRALAEAIADVPDDEPRVIVATGRLVGEGFDDARLDTLFLAMPIAWRGTLQQYAGRLHRLHDEKTAVVIYDYVDAAVPVLARMYEKRLRGYRAMGYRVGGGPAEPGSLLGPSYSKATGKS